MQEQWVPGGVGWGKGVAACAGSVCLTLCPGQVCVEGRLYLEFMFDDMMRIKTWHFSIRQHRELIPRSILAMHVSSAPVLSLPCTRGPLPSPHLEPGGGPGRVLDAAEPCPSHP